MTDHDRMNYWWRRATHAEARLAGWMEHWNATARTGAVDEVVAILEANARAERAEQRICDLTQEVRDERAACLDQMEQVQIRDAQIKAVRNVLDTWMTYCQAEQTGRVLSDIRRALDG